MSSRLILASSPTRIPEAHAFKALEIDPLTKTLPVSPDLSDDNVMLLRVAAQRAEGWFRAEQIGHIVGRNKNVVNSVAQRLERAGYLTAVQAKAGTGKRIGRQITDKAAALLGERAGLGVKAEQAEQAGFSLFCEDLGGIGPGVSSSALSVGRC